MGFEINVLRTLSPIAQRELNSTATSRVLQSDEETTNEMKDDWILRKGFDLKQI
jgi:hypothetical protein